MVKLPSDETAKNRIPRASPCWPKANRQRDSPALPALGNVSEETKVRTGICRSFSASALAAMKTASASTQARSMTKMMLRSNWVASSVCRTRQGVPILVASRLTVSTWKGRPRLAQSQPMPASTKSGAMTGKISASAASGICSGRPAVQLFAQQPLHGLDRHVVALHGAADRFGKYEDQLAVTDLLVLPHMIEQALGGKGLRPVHIGEACRQAGFGEMPLDARRQICVAKPQRT